MTPTDSVRRAPSRTKARKRALDILFEADLREVPALEVLAAHTAEADPAVRPFTAELVEGVIAHRDELDALVGAHLPSGWTLDRMPRVDRNLARLAAYEALHTTTDAAVAIAECLLLATELSTDDSPALLNGVLGAVVRDADPARS
ncbi:MAG: transcription antitermination factor NusB [Actinobacteria bacterium]|nr:transcription antitermination factor NusB [Actinomycetota bacterium]